MVADAFPSPDEHLAKTLRFGVPLDEYNKPNVFNPNAVSETRFAVGRHTAAFEGRIRYPKRDQLLLFHYKFLGIDYLLRLCSCATKAPGSASCHARSSATALGLAERPIRRETWVRRRAERADGALKQHRC
jgi:hypothetical protein